MPPFFLLYLIHSSLFPSFLRLPSSLASSKACLYPNPSSSHCLLYSNSEYRLNFFASTRGILYPQSSSKLSHTSSATPSIVRGFSGWGCRQFVEPTRYYILFILIFFLSSLQPVAFDFGNSLSGGRPIRRKSAKFRSDSIEEKPSILPFTTTSTFRPSF